MNTLLLRSPRLLPALLWCCAALPLGSPAVAAPGTAVLDPAQADADYQYQGEYSGVIIRDGEKVKLGIQVIARGEGKFDAVAYPGGLPGAGWDGEERIAATGELHGETVTLTGLDRNGKGLIHNEQLEVILDGEKAGSLDKVNRESPTLDAEPPEGAVVLFSGKEAELKNFVGARFEDDKLREGFDSKQTFGDQKLHLEFYLSYMPAGRGQGRSNSGCYLQGRYEVQILDSFGLTGENNECGGIYTISAPKVNMCLPPLRWQTYDIDFTAAKYDAAGKKTAEARMTVTHNGILVQDNVALPQGTPGGIQGEGSGPGPLHIQGHGNPVYFRNIWVVKK